MSLVETMAPWHRLGCALFLTVVAAAASAASPISDADGPAGPAGPFTSPASLARIGSQLARPVGMQIALPKEARPTFRVKVRARPYWTDELLVSQFKVPPMSPLLPPRLPGEPGIGAGAGGGGGGGVDPYKAIAAVRRFFQQRAAEKEVRQVLAELCAISACPAR
jgi:hypothetical protein